MFINKISEATKDMNVNPNKVISHVDGISKVLLPSENGIKASAEKAKAAETIERRISEKISNRISGHSG